MIYAFIAIDKDPEDEGVIAMHVKGSWIPLVGADEKRVDSLRQIAQDIAKTTKRKIILAKFTTRKDVEVIKP